MTAIDDFEPTARTYVSQGLALNYLDWGNEKAPLLLLVHGSQDHARSWDWTARALRKDWRVIAADLRGHGDSQWSPEGSYLSSSYVLGVADLVDSLGAEQVTIVGHSMGSTIVARYTAAFPERVRRLALIEGLGPRPESRAEWTRLGPVLRTRDWILKRQTAKPQRRMATLDVAIARMSAANPHLSAEQARHLAVHGVRRHDDGYSWKYDPMVRAYPPEEFTAQGAEVWLQIACPTLSFYGAESFAGNPETDERQARFRDHRSLVFEDAGHWLHHDQFDRFIAALREFL
jgi:pimeloyl-ACP methyl ester carboxylesterase